MVCARTRLQRRFNPDCSLCSASRQAYSTLSIAIRDAGQNRGPGGADEKLTPEGGNITYAKEHDELAEPIPENGHVKSRMNLWLSGRCSFIKPEAPEG